MLPVVVLASARIDIAAGAIYLAPFVGLVSETLRTSFAGSKPVSVKIESAGTVTENAPSITGVVAAWYKLVLLVV
jgi:hypothetical protein